MFLLGWESTFASRSSYGSSLAQCFYDKRHVSHLPSSATRVPTIIVFPFRLQGAILTTMLATRNFSSKYDAQGKYLRPSSALHGPRQTVLLYLLLNFTFPCLCLRFHLSEYTPCNNLRPFLSSLSRRSFVLHSCHRGSVHLPSRSTREVLHDTAVHVTSL